MKISRIPENYHELGIELSDPTKVAGKRFPDFMIIGPWRTGTTWLSEVLRGSPQVFITTPKEPLYFSGLRKQKQRAPKDLLWYLDLFDPGDPNIGESTLYGEASAAYATMLSPDLIRFITAVNPDIRVIFGIRHPVERAWSHAKMNIALQAGKFNDYTPADRMGEVLFRKFLIDAGFYHKHLKKWKSELPENQIHIMNYSRLQHDAAGVLKDVCDFLGVSLTRDESERVVAEVGRVADTAQWEIPHRYRRTLERRYRGELRILEREHQIFFPPPDDRRYERPLVLVPNDTLEYSETFIANHVRGIGGTALSVQEYLPLGDAFTLRITRSFRMWRNMRLLTRRLKLQRGPVLIEYGTTAVRILPVLRKLALNFVIHFHGYDAHRKDILADCAKDYRELFDLAEALIVVSRAMQNVLVGMGARPEKIHHVVCGISPRLFQPTDVAANDSVFFACGRFVEKKAPDATIRAFYQALQQCPEIRLRIAGQGPLFASCQRLVVELGISRQVDFLGILSQREVAQELRKCRAFVQHSVTAANGDSEGTPVGILEACCSAVPVIATRHTGIRDVVIEQETGLLCDERDVDSMAEAIVQLTRSPELAGTMGVNARAHIMENYTLPVTIEKLRNVLGDSIP